MYATLTHTLLREQVPATPAHLLDLIGGIAEGFAPTLGDLFMLARATYVKKPAHEGGFQRAFFEYFAGIPSRPEVSLERSIAESTPYQEWALRNTAPTGSDGVRLFIETLFGDAGTLVRGEVADPELAQLLVAFQARMGEKKAQPHKNKRYQLASDARSTLEGGLEDTGGYTVRDDHVAEPIDFSGVDDGTLDARLRDLLQTQQERHEGGDTWIGQKGNSAFGNAGFSRYGIRVGGKGRLGTARNVLGGAKTAHSLGQGVKGYEAADMQEALKGLTLMVEEGPRTVLDLRRTMRTSGRRGYVQLHYGRKEVDMLHLALFIDNGGRSMNRHIASVERLFAKMRNHAKSLDIFYFHNSIRDPVYADQQRSVPVPLGAITSLSPETRVVIVGDASMSPHREFDKDALSQLRQAFPYSAWLNPVPQTGWDAVQSIGMTRALFEMFPLTVEGLYAAVGYLTKPTGSSGTPPR